MLGFMSYNSLDITPVGNPVEVKLYFHQFDVFSMIIDIHHESLEVLLGDSLYTEKIFAKVLCDVFGVLLIHDW